MTAANRKIIHVDMDAFFASVEIRDRPELRGRPVVVGGSPEGRGVVCAASYEARKFGVRSAISCRKAFQLCPQAVFVSPRFDRYQEVSREIRAVFREVTDRIEPLSLDEAYLDVTENHFGEERAGILARWIRAEIRARLGLTASAGVAPNKLVAKIASDYRKPDGLTVVAPERVEQFMSGFSVGRLWGVGEKTEKRLNEAGFFKVTDLRASTPEKLRELLGSFGPDLYEQSWGRDDRPVISHWEPKSRGSERTFSRDIQDASHLMAIIDELASEVSEDLERIGRPGRTVTLKIRYGDFETITRSETIALPTQDALVIGETARALLFKNTEVGERPVRLLGLSMSSLVGPSGDLDESGGTPEQLWLPFTANRNDPRGS